MSSLVIHPDVNAIDIFSFVLVILVLAVVYFARFCLRHSEKLTSGELAKRYSHLGWVKWGHPIVIGVVFWPLFLWVIYGTEFGDRSVVLGVPIFSVLPLLEGLIALSTGVYSASTRVKFLYVYDIDKDLTWIAWLEIISAVVITVVSLVGFYVVA